MRTSTLDGCTISGSYGLERDPAGVDLGLRMSLSESSTRATLSAPDEGAVARR